MRLKMMCVLLTATFALLVGTAQAAKSYRVSVREAIKAGSAQLQAGEYTLVLDNSKVRFTEVRTGKEVEVDAKIEDGAEKKFDSTAVHSKQVEGTAMITEIRLGGTKTKVVFP